MIILSCRLRLSSQMSLEEIGRAVSGRVLGGIPFVGREEHIRDEVPAIFSQSEVLGIRFILMGEPDDEGYYLEADSRSLIANLSAEQIKESLFDICLLYTSDAADERSSVDLGGRGIIKKKKRVTRKNHDQKRK